VETTQVDSDVCYIEELHSIKEEVTSLRNDFSRFLQRANQQHIEGMLAEMRKGFMKPMVDYLCEDASERMHSQMTRDCAMRDFCETTFKELLQETAGLVGRPRVEAGTVRMYREKLEELKKEAKNPSMQQMLFQKPAIFLKNRSNLCVLFRYMKTGKKKTKKAI